MTAIVAAVFKTTWKKNPISGHEWPEHQETGLFRVSGAMCNQVFRSDAKAQEHADFLNKWCFANARPSK